jgi:hypothetical protein
MSSPSLPSDRDADTPADPVAAEIEAEIADHLATTAERLETQGVSSPDARQKSQEKFGDAAAIGRRCYWIKQGDTLMFRGALIALLAVLSIGLAMTVLVSWQTQSGMAEQMRALAEQLKELAERQKEARSAPPAPAEPKPLEIQGKVYHGSPDKPAAGTEVMICRAADGEIVRRVSTNDGGVFQSGPLNAGDYTLVANGVPDGPYRKLGIQTAPLYVYPGAPLADVQIDATYRSGRVAIEISRPLPKVEVEGKYTIDSRLYIGAQSNVMQRTRWLASRPVPDHWPIYVENPDTAPQVSSDRGEPDFALRPGIALSKEDLATSSEVIFLNRQQGLPAGPCLLVAVVLADVLPSGALAAPSGYRPDNESRPWLSTNWIYQEPMGALWLEKLNLLPRANTRNVAWGNKSDLPRFSSRSFFPDPQLVAKAAIGDGQTTRLRVEIPPDIEKQIQDLLDSESGADCSKFVEAIRKDNPFIRKAKITVTGTEPIEQESGQPAAGDSSVGKR